MPLTQPENGQVVVSAAVAATAASTHTRKNQIVQPPPPPTLPARPKRSCLAGSPQNKNGENNPSGRIRHPPARPPSRGGSSALPGAPGAGWRGPGRPEDAGSGPWCSCGRRRRPPCRSLGPRPGSGAGLAAGLAPPARQLARGRAGGAGRPAAGRGLSLPGPRLHPRRAPASLRRQPVHGVPPREPRPGRPDRGPGGAPPARLPSPELPPPLLLLLLPGRRLAAEARLAGAAHPTIHR